MNNYEYAASAPLPPQPPKKTEFERNTSGVSYSKDSLINELLYLLEVIDEKYKKAYELKEKINTLITTIDIEKENDSYTYLKKIYNSIESEINDPQEGLFEMVSAIILEIEDLDDDFNVDEMPEMFISELRNVIEPTEESVKESIYVEVNNKIKKWSSMISRFDIDSKIKAVEKFEESKKANSLEERLRKIEEDFNKTYVKAYPMTRSLSNDMNEIRTTILKLLHSNDINDKLIEYIEDRIEIFKYNYDSMKEEVKEYKEKLDASYKKISSFGKKYNKLMFQIEETGKDLTSEQRSSLNHINDLYGEVTKNYFMLSGFEYSMSIDDKFSEIIVFEMMCNNLLRYEEYINELTSLFNSIIMMKNLGYNKELTMDEAGKEKIDYKEKTIELLNLFMTKGTISKNVLKFIHKDFADHPEKLKNAINSLIDTFNSLPSEKISELDYLECYDLINSLPMRFNTLTKDSQQEKLEKLSKFNNKIKAKNEETMENSHVL